MGGHGGPPLQNVTETLVNAGVFVGVALRGHPRGDFLCKATCTWIGSVPLPVVTRSKYDFNAL